MADDLERLDDIALIPVVELDPGRFSPDRTPPTGPGSAGAEAWGRRWRDRLAEAGVVGLEPIEPGLWHVATSRLTDPATLVRILDVGGRREDGTSAWREDPARPLPGGGVLFSGSRMVAEPTCCSDLGDIGNWEEASARRSPGWATLWIGHPWHSARFADGRIVLSDLHEDDEPVPRWSIDPGELARAVAAARAEQAAFAERLARAIEILGGAESPETPRRLAGLYG